MPRVLRQNTLPFVEKKNIVTRSRNKKSVEVVDKNLEISPRKCLNNIENLLSPSKKRILKYEDNHLSPSKKLCSPKKTDTPSSALSKLCLQSPANNQKSDKPSLSRKELFPDQAGVIEARKAFYNSNATVLPGRQIQIEKLKCFFLDHLATQKSGSLYISGPPGTGKTASLNSVINETEIMKKFKVVYVNCTSIQSSKNVFNRIVDELHISVSGKTEQQYLTAINKYLLKKHKMILLVLDEIDQLSTRTQSVLYSIFEWPSLENSKIILVGIANAIDLTDRILPRLNMRVELKPVLMHFAPYSKEEIVDILQYRLSEVGVSHDLAIKALQLIAGKVAASSGDIRQALDLSRRVIEISSEKSAQNKGHGDPVIKTISKKEEITGDVKSITDSIRKSPRKQNLALESPAKFNDSPRKSPVKQNVALESPIKLHDSPRKSPRKQNVINYSPVKNGAPVKKLDLNIDPRDVISVVKNIYGTCKTFNNEDSCYPLHQKLLICVMLLIMKKGKHKNLNIGQFHQVYHKVCHKLAITSVDLSCFINLCKQVEMTGAVHIGKGNGKLAKIILQWDETEISNTIKDQQLLSSVLNDNCSFLS